MKTLNENYKWSVSLKDAQTSGEEIPRPKIGDDDGISNKSMNVLIVIFTLITLGIAFTANAQNDQLKYRILLRQAMLDMDRADYDKAASKLLEVRANTAPNANVDHMLGVCYLYGEGEPAKAAFYFERAAQNVSPDHEDWDLDETRAPIETYYQLAKAYEDLRDFAKASELYGKFLMAMEVGKVKASERTLALITQNAKRCEAAAEQLSSMAEDKIVLNQ